MPYAPTTWVDGVTPVNAANLNKLEIGLQNAVGVPADTVVAFNAFLLRNELAAPDTQPAFRLMGDGKIEWGPGGGTAPDTFLFRRAPHSLSTENVVIDAGTLDFDGDAATDTALGAWVTTDPNYRVKMNHNGKLEWGDGTAAADTNLYRYTTAILKTDGALRTGGVVTVREGAAEQVVIGAAAGVHFGSASDTALYRSAANYLKTDGSLSVGGASTGELKVQAGLFEVALGRFGGAAEAAIRLGGDTNLYRAAAGALKTDGSLTVGAGGVSLRTDGQIEAGTNFWTKSDVGRIYFGAAFDASIYRLAANVLTTPGQFRAANGFQTDGVISLGAASYIYSGSGAAGTAVLITRATGDGGNRFQLTNAGKMDWGDGTAAADATLYRASAGKLKTDGSFNIVGFIEQNGQAAGATIWAAAASGDGNYRFTVGNDGAMNWGPGTGPQDTNLYRAAPNRLKTDDAFQAPTLTSSPGTASEISLWSDGFIYFHNSGDTSISRAAAGVVKAWGALADTAFGTALPGSPVDGQMFTLVDSLTAPTYAWMFRYVAGIADAYKWVCIGGSPLIAFIGTNEASSSTTYVNLATVGPTLTLPRAGTYDVLVGCQFFQGGGGALPQYMSYAIGATAAVDANAFSGFAAPSSNLTSGDRTVRLTVATASVALVAKYRTGASGTDWRDRKLSAMPVRVA